MGVARAPMNIRALAYVSIEARNLEAWQVFADEFLGMPSSRASDTQLFLRMDERTHRFDIRRGDRDQLLALGWEVASQRSLHETATNVNDHGVEVARATERQARERGVLDFIAFNDPAGIRQEIVYGPAADFRPFMLTRPMSGYLTGELGMGHVVIGVQNFDACLDFYVNVLGLRISDTYKSSIAFLHCNPRHHSVALVGSDRPGLRHIMLETRLLDDVGSALDIANRGGYLTRTLGRHSNDQAVSFYVATPSGWEIEYGWNGLQLNDEEWVARQVAGATSLWGHELVDDRRRASSVEAE
jgi:2,3-dihydroxybiphenyl 1,2-dioxygenase